MKLDQQAEMFCDTCKASRIFNFGRLNNGSIGLQCLTCKANKQIDDSKHCCTDMKEEITNEEIIEHDPISGEYAIKYPDGSNINTIKHCPWCGIKLPEVMNVTYLPEEVSTATPSTVTFDRTDWAITFVALILAIIVLICYVIMQ